MALTPTQLQTLKTDILGDATLNAFPNTPDGAFEIAAAYNLPASPDFWVRRTAVTKAEYVGSTSQDGTTFTWVGNGFITRSAGEQAAWRELFDSSGTVNPSLASVQQAFSDIFSGTGNAAANRTHLIAVSRRKSSRVEKLLATGTGTTAAPAVMGYEGTISYQEVYAARNAS